MIIAGQLLLPNGPASVALTPGWLRIVGDRIAEVHAGPCPHTPDFGGEDRVITPGFIDTHVHLPQFDSIGVDGLELLDWLDRAVFPMEHRWADAEFADEMTAYAADLLLSCGTTTVAAYATVHHAAAQRAIDRLASKGVSGICGQVLMDRNAPGYLVRPAGQLLAEASRLVPRGRVMPSVTPRFAISCSAELMRGAGELAARTGWMIQTHLSETARECEMVRSLFHVEHYVQAYARCGVLTNRTILAHGIHLSAQELAEICRIGARIAHCPTANLFLQAGAMDLHERERAGVTMGLGSDVAGGPDVSMVRVARAMIETCKRRAIARGEVMSGSSAERLPTAGEAMWMITAGNARVLGLEDVGVLRPGAMADVLVVCPGAGPREALRQRAADLLGHMLYAWDDRWLEATISGGMVRYLGGRSRA